jgi:TonB family protein
MQDTTPRHRPPPDLGSLGFLLEVQPAERRRIRIGLCIAVLAHVGLFAVSWPTIARSEPEPAPQPVRPVILHRLTPPSPPPPEATDAIRPLRGRPVPVPGPPERLEPIVVRDATIEAPDAPDEEGGDDGNPLPFPEPPSLPRTDTIAVVGVDVEAPILLHEVVPVYPEPARIIRREGAVILSLVIDRSGRVDEVTVLRGQPFGLTEAAVTAVRQWVFAPSTVDGRPVPVQYILTVHFSLG